MTRDDFERYGQVVQPKDVEESRGTGLIPQGERALASRAGLSGLSQSFHDTSDQDLTSIQIAVSIFSSSSRYQKCSRSAWSWLADRLVFSTTYWRSDREGIGRDSMEDGRDMRGRDKRILAKCQDLLWT